jgi:hypothetical protein
MRPRWLWLALGLSACGGERAKSFSYAKYQPSLAPDPWCRIGDGGYAFVPSPQMSPPLAGHACSVARREQSMARPRASTFAELVVEPGASIVIPVRLPAPLRATGCRIDSVLIAHGMRVSDMALEIASASGVQPIVSYEKLPPPREQDEARRVVRDGSGMPAGIWAPNGVSDSSPYAVVAERDLWPTNAVLRFPGGQDAEGAASIVWAIERPAPAVVERSEEPGARAGAGTGAGAPPEAESPGLVETPSSLEGAPRGEHTPGDHAPGDHAPKSLTVPSDFLDRVPSSQKQPPGEAGGSGEQPAETGEPSVGVRPAPPLEQVAYRHRIDLPASDEFSVVLRAREKPFAIGVRSDRESRDPTLFYKAPGAAAPVPTHLVPQVGIVVARCGRPLSEVLREIR